MTATFTAIHDLEADRAQTISSVPSP